MKSIATRHRAGIPLLVLILFLVAGCGGGGEVPQKNCGGGPCPPPTDAPALSVAAGDTENVLTVTPPAGVTAPTFDIYWSTSPDVTTANGTRIAAQTSPFHHTGLTNGTPIFYVATITGGNSASAVAGGMPGKWTQLLQGAASVPPARDSHTAVYNPNPNSDRMIVFGGRAGNQPLNDLWILQGASTTSPAWNGPVLTNAPQGRLGHTAVYSTGSKQMTVFGGSFDASGTSLTNDLLKLTNADAGSGSVWNQLTGGASPTPRWGHAAVYDSTDDRMIVFGGSTQTNGALANDVWILDHATTSPFWRPITTTGAPSARCCMVAAYDPAGHRMIVFGGFGGFNQSGPIVFGDLWTLTFTDAAFTTATWQKLIPLG
ncbi:MAG TPA: kelch repeat-containing protein, partial [Candidatus Manganitrophaceae bacterium]|nr:kelch repeat-containing protein [Candidatus Manganitrophaceae bacterium]